MLGTQGKLTSPPRQQAAGAHWEIICVALEDPSVVEIMLNPDGRLFIKRSSRSRHGRGWEMTRSAAETVIGSVARILNSEVDDERPIVSGELPIEADTVPRTAPTGRLGSVVHHPPSVVAAHTS